MLTSTSPGRRRSTLALASVSFPLSSPQNLDRPLRERVATSDTEWIHAVVRTNSNRDAPMRDLALLDARVLYEQTAQQSVTRSGLRTFRRS